MRSDDHAPRTPAPSPGGVSLRLIVLPNEHGSWSFLGEPILLGLLVAFSPAGFAVALAAVFAFLARQPLKLFVSDQQRGKIYPRTHAARLAFAVLAVAAAGSLGAALLLGEWRLLWAVVAAAPLAALAVAFDLGKRSRDLAAELAGAVALGAVATAIALSEGLPGPRAFALWAVLAARTLPTILFVRARLRLEKGQPYRSAPVHGSHAAAILAALLLEHARVLPQAVVWAMVLLAARAAYGLTPWRPRWKPWQLGISEIVFGVITVLCAAARVR